MDDDEDNLVSERVPTELQEDAEHATQNSLQVPESQRMGDATFSSGLYESSRGTEEQTEGQENLDISPDEVVVTEDMIEGFSIDVQEI